MALEKAVRKGRVLRFDSFIVEVKMREITSKLRESSTDKLQPPIIIFLFRIITTGKILMTGAPQSRRAPNKRLKTIGLKTGARRL